MKPDYDVSGAIVNHRNGEQRLPATLARWRGRDGVLWFGHLAPRAATYIVKARAARR
jgi:hypothetical protein